MRVILLIYSCLPFSGEGVEHDPYATVTLLRQPQWFSAKSDSSTCLLSDSGSGEGS